MCLPDSSCTYPRFFRIRVPRAGTSRLSADYCTTAAAVFVQNSSYCTARRCWYIPSQYPRQHPQRHYLPRCETTVVSRDDVCPFAPRHIVRPSSGIRACPSNAPACSRWVKCAPSSTDLFRHALSRVQTSWLSGSKCTFEYCWSKSPLPLQMYTIDKLSSS